VCALIDIEGLDGVILAGASKSQRLALRTVNINTGGDQTVGILVQGKGAAAGRHIQLGYIDITGKTSYDKGAGLSITDVGLSWVHDVTVHDWTGTGVDTNLQTTSHRVQSVVFENVTVVNSGKTTAGTYPIAESYYLGGAEYSDARAGGGVWCLHCASGNGFADGLDAFGCTSGGTDGILKLRDSAWYGNGRNGIATMLFNGHESGGDHLGAGAFTSGTGATLPEQTSVDIRSVFYNNAGYGLAAPHGGGSRYVWQSTFYRAGAGAVGQGAAVLVHIDSNSLGIFDSIIDNASSGLPIAMERGQGGSTSDGNRTAPVVKNTLIRGPATSATLASFDTMCTADNGATDTGQHCKNGSCPSGQTCRMTPINVNVTTTYGAGPGIPGFLNDTGNRVGVDDPKFVSNGGQFKTSFSLSTGAPGFTDCDFHLQSGSPAIDPPTPLFVLLANGAGTDSSTITVKASTPEPEQVLNPPIAGSNYAAIDGSLAWGSRPHIADPRTYFVSPQNHPWATGDVIQIVGTCAHGASRRGAAGRAQIVSMTSSTITVDDTCTWADGAGVHWPYNGNAPDLGAYEFGLSNTGLAAPTLLSVDPVQP